MKYRARHRGPIIDRVKVRELIDRGLTNLEVADALGCAPNTIPNIKRELGYPVETRAHRGVAKLPPGVAERNKLERDRKRSKAKYQRRAIERVYLKGAEAKSAMLRQASLFDAVDAGNTTPNPQPRTVPIRSTESTARRVDTETFAERAPSVPAKPWDGKPVTLLDLTARQCAFVVKPGNYPVIAECCGAPVVGATSWCAGHITRVAGKGTPSEQRAGEAA
jgi:hypothetical protein